MSRIEWTEKTWNPVVGCTILSPGCTNCYAMKQAHRIQAMYHGANLQAGRGAPYPPSPYDGTTKDTKAGPVWTGKVAWGGDEKLLEPLRRKRPTTYFVNSMSDLFHEDVPDEWIDRVFAVMALSPQHTFQVLTKRAKRMREYCTGLAGKLSWRRAAIGDAMFEISGRAIGQHQPEMPLPNVWLGVSAEDQPRADQRVPELLATPAAVRFVSAEPLLGPIVMPLAWLRQGDNGAWPHDVMPGTGLDWIIVGGESGPNARPMQVPWARSIVQQCKASGVACFVKQLGADPIWEDGAFLNLAHRKGADMAKWPDDLRVREVPDATA